MPGVIPTGFTPGNRGTASHDLHQNVHSCHSRDLLPDFGVFLKISGFRVFFGIFPLIGLFFVFLNTRGTPAPAKTNNFARAGQWDWCPAQKILQKFCRFRLFDRDFSQHKSPNGDSKPVPDRKIYRESNFRTFMTIQNHLIRFSKQNPFLWRLQAFVSAHARLSRRFKTKCLISLLKIADTMRTKCYSVYDVFIYYVRACPVSVRG